MLALGCTKQPNLDGGKGGAFPVPGEQKISIPCPLVTPATKALAGEMPLNYSTDESFGVYALYYPTGNFSGWKSTPGSTIYIDGAEFRYIDYWCYKCLERTGRFCRIGIWRC